MKRKQINPFVLRARLTIVESMQPMLAQAKRDGLILWNRYQNVSFTPTELQKLMAEGRYIWGPDNWELRLPVYRAECFDKPRAIVDD